MYYIYGVSVPSLLIESTDYDNVHVYVSLPGTSFAQSNLFLTSGSGCTHSLQPLMTLHVS